MPSDTPPAHLEPTTVWSFPERGRWATHKGNYPGNWAPQVPHNLILRYSQPGDRVLDPFVGSGTTLIECKLLNRHGIGIDINPQAIQITRERLIFSTNNATEQEVLIGDARQIPYKSDTIDLICTHPPYADAIQYSNNTLGDLSKISNIDQFINEISRVAVEFWRVLKPDHNCGLLMGDIRRKRHVIPLGFLTMHTFLNVGFVLQEIIIKVQHNCASTEYWIQKAKRANFLLLMHEYIFILKKKH